MIYVHKIIDNVNPLPLVKECWNLCDRIKTVAWILSHSLQLYMVHRFTEVIIKNIPPIKRIAIHAGLFCFLTEGRPKSWFKLNYWEGRRGFGYDELANKEPFQEMLNQAFNLIYKIFMISSVINYGLGGSILSAYINKNPDGLPYLIKIFSVFQSVMVVAGIPLVIFLPRSDGVFVATYLGMSGILPHLEKMRSICNSLLK